MDRRDGRPVAIVTGAARGIGAATAARLGRDGFHIVAVDRDREALATLGESVDADHTAVLGDVDDPATATQAVAAAVEHGRLRVLVNNAGIVVDRAFTAQPDEEWELIWRTVVQGTRRMTRAVTAQMQADAEGELQAGPEAVPTPRRIITTVPASAVTGTAGGSASAAAGGAIAATTRTLARELGGWGIRVNAVVVGHIATRMTQPLPDGVALASADAPGLPEPVRQMVAATTALGRLGDPAEVAAVHAFLAGDDADYVTGAVIPVTGGLLGT